MVGARGCTLKKVLTLSLVTLLTSLVTLTGLVSFMPNRAMAVQKNDACHQTAGFFNFPTWYEYLEVGPKSSSKGTDPCAIIGPADPVTGELDFQRALPRIALAIVEVMLRVAGMAAVAMVIFAGFKYMTSQGEPDATKKAQATAANALIGLTVAVLASVIVTFVGSTLWQ